MTRIGLVGGTFDPVHMGHLIGAERAADWLALDRVLFVPAATPPHKHNRSISGADHRLAMLRAAVEGNPRFGVLTDELDRGGAFSYTIDTVLGVRRSIEGDSELYLIVGADNLVDFSTWKDWREIAGNCRLVGLERPGSNDAREKVTRRMPELEPLWVPMPPIGISSTEIRERAAEGRSIRYLVPENVRIYIERNGLYGRACG